MVWIGTMDYSLVSQINKKNRNSSGFGISYQTALQEGSARLPPGPGQCRNLCVGHALPGTRTLDTSCQALGLCPEGSVAQGWVSELGGNLEAAGANLIPRLA